MSINFRVSFYLLIASKVDRTSRFLYLVTENRREIQELLYLSWHWNRLYDLLNTAFRTRFHRFALCFHPFFEPARSIIGFDPFVLRVSKKMVSSREIFSVRMLHLFGSFLYSYITFYIATNLIPISSLILYIYIYLFFKRHLRDCTLHEFNLFPPGIVSFNSFISFIIITNKHFNPIPIFFTRYHLLLYIYSYFSSSN